MWPAVPGSWWYPGHPRSRVSDTPDMSEEGSLYRAAALDRVRDGCEACLPQRATVVIGSDESRDGLIEDDRHVVKKRRCCPHAPLGHHTSEDAAVLVGHEVSSVR